MGDVLLSSENAKRVLREVCILRRLSHPHIIRLLDVFIRPAQTGGGDSAGLVWEVAVGEPGDALEPESL